MHAQHGFHLDQSAVDNISKAIDRKAIKDLFCAEIPPDYDVTTYESPQYSTTKKISINLSPKSRIGDSIIPAIHAKRLLELLTSQPKTEY